MTKAEAGKLPIFTLLILLITTAPAFGQVQQEVEEPKPAGAQAQAEDEKQEVFAEVITPPAPIVIRKDPNAILIPSEDPRSYEERAAALSNIKIGSFYGYRRDPFTRRARFHSGLDIKAASGEPVGASHPGTVQFAGWYYGYGNLVIVDHGGGITTYYAHLSSFEIMEGDKVERGVIIGYAGKTGRATSPHLHYEVRIDGNPVNPLQPLALDPSSEFFVESKDAIQPEKADEPTVDPKHNNP